MWILPWILTLGAFGSPGSSIQWRADYEGTLEQAKAERRGVFVALLIDGEARCDAFVKDVYAEKFVIQFAESTLNVVASPGQHKRKGACKLFAGVECIDHQRADTTVRSKLVAQNDLGVASVPQHLWLDPDGAVILSVPFEMTADEVLWCFAFAQWRLDPKSSFVLPEGARAPRRLIFGASHRPADGTTPGRGLIESELQKELNTLKGSFWNEGRIGTWLRVVFTDDERAVRTIQTELGTGALTWGGVERLNQALDVIGEWSPASFSPLLLDYVKHRDAQVRRHTAVGLEQMGAPDTVSAIKRALSKEKDASVEKAWLRALGSCGYADKSVRKLLLKKAKSEKEAELRINATLALGWSGGEEAVVELLESKLTSEDENEVVAALCAAAISRDPLWIPKLEEFAKKAPEGRVRTACESALTVLRGASLTTIESEVRLVAGDELRRGRIFFGTP